MISHLSETTVEEAALAWLEALGYVVLPGEAVAPSESGAERADYGQ
jgi:type I restriction enzyme R subunit